MIQKTFICFVTLLLFSCREDTEIRESLAYANRLDFEIIGLSQDELPYALDAPISKNINYLVDEDSIPLFPYKGEIYYHPVLIAQKILPLLSSYTLTADSVYLKRAQLFSDKLLDISDQNDDMIFFLYPFSFNLHGYTEDLMTAPWVSGMAQGQILSVFSRLYNITEEETYLNIASKIYDSFFRLANNVDYWCTYIDSNNYAWIEEYPDYSEPNFTLNGFIFAIFGLYDYYSINPSSELEEIIQICLTTIKHYIPDFRNEGYLSFYCLTHKVTDLHYHHVHIDQLNYLFAMTGDSTFYQYAQLFIEDHE
jgi:hypothetical protein